MKLKRIERIIQLAAAIVSIPLYFAFQVIGVFVRSCYTGFMKGWNW